MADFKTDIADASQDLKTIEDFVNLPAGSEVKPRLLPSVDVGTLSGIRDAIFEAGGLPAKPFATLVKMQTDGASLADGTLAQVYNETANNGLYVKSAGAWVKSKYDIAEQLDKKTALILSNSVVFSDPLLVGTKYIHNYISPSSNTVSFNASSFYTTYKFEIEKNTQYRLSVTGSASKFRVGLVNSVNVVGEVNIPIAKMLVNNDSLVKKEIIFNSGEAVELYTYLADTSLADISCELSVYPRRISTPIFADGLKNPVTESDIADASVSANKTTFLESTEHTRDYKRVDYGIFYNTEENNAYLNKIVGGWTYEAPIYPNEYIKIGLTDGSKSRFRIGVMNTEVVSYIGKPSLDRVVNLDNSLREFDFVNDDKGKWLIITLETSAYPTSEPKPIVNIVERKIKGLSGVGSSNNTPTGFRLDIGKIENTTSSTISKKAEYPRLACVKYEYAPNTAPIPVGYLYSTNSSPYELLYSSGRPDNMVKIADWNRGITRGGTREPSHCTMFVTDDGDIIVLHRGDLFGDDDVNLAARQNPIIYPAGDYNNPIVVDFGDKIKPTGWARCNGVTSVPDKDFFLFSEYTRTAHAKAYMWKVTKPYTNPDNWVRVAEFTVDRLKPDGSQGDMKHWHATNYDPYSGAILASFGDYEVGAKILISKDDGDTWSVEAEGQEGICRLSQYIFTEDYVYWGTDSAGASHNFVRAPRDELGYPKLALADLEVIHSFPYTVGFVATYNTVLLSNPNGILFLDRNDTSSDTTPLNIYFWSFDADMMYDVAHLHQLPDALAESAGFRCDTVTLYQPVNDDRVTIGFNAIFAKNAMDIVGNSSDDRVNNLTLKVVQI